MAVPTTSASGAQASQETSGLLQLPPELRNQVYRHAIINPQAIAVSSSGFEVPALFTTCKQFRNETIALFYTENTFAVAVKDYDFSLLAKWENNIDTIFNSEREIADSVAEQVELVGTEDPNWSNLLCWMRKMHEGTVKYRAAAPSAFRDANLNEVVIGVMFAMTLRMEARRWSEVEQMLDDFRLILAKIDPRWDM